MPRTKTKAQRELEEIAAMVIEPWEYTPTPGPSHEQWKNWNNEHGTALRMACAIMALTKEKLATMAKEFEGKGGFESILDKLDRSFAFFTDMAETIRGAQGRILYGAAVFALRKEKPPRRRSPLKLVKSDVKEAAKAVQS